MAHNKQYWLDQFVKLGVLRSGHFLLTSGRHSDRFMLCSQLFQHPGPTAEAVSDLKEKLGSLQVDVVIGPAMGGVILAYETARALGCRAIYAEKDDKGGMALRRGFSLQPCERVLVVEDAVSTGGSIRKVIDVVQSHGANLVGVAALVDRTGGTVTFEAPFTALMTMEIESFIPEECPLCKQEIPLTKPKS